MSKFEKHLRIYLVSGHHKNIEIDPNPDLSRGTPMYIVKTEQKDKRAALVKN